MKNQKVDIGSPDVQSSANSVLAQWKDTFETTILKLNDKQQKVLNKLKRGNFKNKKTEKDW